jgi:hypothetical protein
LLVAASLVKWPGTTGRIYRQVDQRLHTLGQIDGVGAEIVLGLPEFQIAFFTMP